MIIFFIGFGIGLVVMFFLSSWLFGIFIMFGLKKGIIAPGERYYESQAKKMDKNRVDVCFEDK